ncbi:unnamed protein product [Closterium sp. Naga37s-1]|nr:unnamed protein product [Closterium sp. Naga37s-1]
MVSTTQTYPLPPTIHTLSLPPYIPSPSHHTYPLPPTIHTLSLPPYIPSPSHHTYPLPPTIHTLSLPPYIPSPSPHTYPLPPLIHTLSLPPYIPSPSPHTYPLPPPIHTLSLPPYIPFSSPPPTFCSHPPSAAPVAARGFAALCSAPHLRLLHWFLARGFRPCSTRQAEAADVAEVGGMRWRCKRLWRQQWQRQGARGGGWAAGRMGGEGRLLIGLALASS